MAWTRALHYHTGKSLITRFTARQISTEIYAGNSGTGADERAAEQGVVSAEMGAFGGLS
jgi:hypothetical protein